MVTAYIALGSNLGDRAAHLRAASQELENHPVVSVLGKSRIYETAPMGGPVNQDSFLNAVLSLETALPARELLALLLSIESLRGRVRRIRWGPRTLDLDLLLYGAEIIHEAGLTIPHPGLTQRAFVLAPLADLAPRLIIPGSHLTVTRLLSETDCSEVVPTTLEF